jgi:predicted phosphate transport protein (TIGR00153 family)
MRLDRILQVLLPHDDHFFNLFEESAHNIVLASEALLKYPSASLAERQHIVEIIGQYEHDGDDVTHKIFSELSGTFVTPFDPEDIHLLGSELDDVLDNIDGSARRLMLYKVQHCPTDILKLMESLHGSVLVLEEGIKHLRKLNKPDELRRIIQRINKFEDEADGIFARGVADLFENLKEPIEIIKLKEVYVSLETATDKCEDVADVLETILLKHA